VRVPFSKTNKGLNKTSSLVKLVEMDEKKHIFDIIVPSTLLIRPNGCD